MKDFYYAVAYCIFISLLYVSGLYLSPNKYARDDTNVILWRFLFVSITCTIAVLIPYFANKNVVYCLNVKKDCLFSALFLPFIHVLILFAAPIFQLIVDNEISSQSNKIIFIRNYVVAPFTEEFIFRCCMLSLLTRYSSVLTSILISSFLFGLAHLHHIFENVYQGINLSHALLVSIIQFSYTTVFGLYVSTVYIITDHLISCFTIHAFCNAIGFPDFQRILKHPNSHYRLIMRALLIFGFLGWLFTWPYIMNPTLYKPTKIQYKQT